MKELHGLLSAEQCRRVEARWGQAPGDIAPIGWRWGWQADGSTIAESQSIYADLEDSLDGV